MLSTRDPPQNRGHIQTESEGLEMIFHANGDQKKAGVAILISDKIDFEIKAVIRDKEAHYLMIKRSIQEVNVTIINIWCRAAQLAIIRLMSRQVCCFGFEFINIFCISCLEKILQHLLRSWFGGAEFSQLLLVCKAFDFSFIFE